MRPARWILVFCFLAASGQADVMVFTFTHTFQDRRFGGSLTATFTDWGGSMVKLVIDSDLPEGASLASNEALVLNLNELLLNGGLSFTFDKGGSTFLPAANISVNLDAFKARGSGDYDVRFAYPGSTYPFNAGAAQTYWITSANLGGIHVIDFYEVSAGRRQGGPYFAAAHVVGASGGAWTQPFVTYQITEDSPLMLLAVNLLLCALANVARRVRK